VKNILIIGSSKGLKAELEKTKFFSAVKTCLTFDGREMEKVDILIVDSSTISCSCYIQNFPKFLKKVKSNYYIAVDMDTYSTVNKTLSSYGIIVIPPLLTDKQVSQKVCSFSVDDFDASGNIVCFFGAGPEVGVGMISLSTAQLLSEITGKSTVLLNLGGREGNDYLDVDSGTGGLSEIKERLINNILSPEEFKSSCVKKEDLYILSGEKEISKVRHYHPDHIEKLVDLSNQTFDITVVNGGSSVSGMSIGALNSSKIKYLIATQSDKHFRSFGKLYEQVFSKLGINSDDFFLIVNKYIDLPELDTEIVLARKYGMQVALVIPLLDYTLSLEAERERKTLLGCDKLFESSIKQLTVSLCSILSIEILDTGKSGKRGSFLSRILGRT
jgi:Flp pilus assembly CpaE family ATPase